MILIMCWTVATLDKYITSELTMTFHHEESLEVPRSFLTNLPNQFLPHPIEFLSRQRLEERESFQSFFQDVVLR